MSTTKAQQKAVQKYVKDNYDKILVTIPKGKRDEWKAALPAGMSMNAFIMEAVEEKFSRLKTE
jgi:hypothetical protein